MIPLTFLAAVSVRGQTTITQNFQTTSATGWNFTNSTSTYTPQSGQQIGTTGTSGLELSNNATNTATAAQYTGTFNSAGASVYATFNYQMFGGSGGTTLGGDGITFFLYDGSQVNTFSAGAYGGSMGYAQKTGINGLSGGYIGVGLDAYGNFSSASEGRVGGYNNTTGQVTESIAVRGPGSGTNGYNYLGGTSAHLGTGNTSTNIDSTSPTSSTNTVQILLSATNQLTVTLAQGGTSPQTVLQLDLSGYTRPGTLSFGFTAGSGNATDNMFVNNLTVTTLTASTWTNSNGNGNWSLNTNWNPTVVPTSGSDILFDNSSVSTAQTIDTGANRTVRSITFDAPFNYTVNNNTFTIDNGGVAGFSGIAVTQTHGTGVDTLNSSLSLNNDIHVSNNANGTLNLNGAIANNGHAITVEGSGTGTFIAGAISGTGALTKNDAGTATLSGTNSFSGGTTINDGTLNANSSTALGTGAVTLAGGILGSTNNASISNNVSLTGDAGMSGITNGGTLTQSGANRTFNMLNATQNGAVKLSDSNTGHTLTVEVDSGSSTINGAIGNGGTGTGNVTKTGTGTLVLGGANTYTGTTTINAGTVQLSSSDRLASTSAVSIGASGTLNLNGYSQKVGSLTAAGGATIDFGPTGTANTFIFGTYTPPTSGVLVINNWESGSDKLGTTTAGQNVSTIYISGYGVASEAGSTSSFGTYGNAYLLTPSTATNDYWTATSTNTWNTSSNWSLAAKPGTTQIAVFDGSHGATQTNVSLNGNNTIAGLQFGSDAPSYTISGTSTLTLSGSVPYIQQKSANNQTISALVKLGNNTVADITGSGNLTMSGAISGTVNLIKDGTGSGKLILSGNNTLSGGIFVNNGILQASANGANTVLGTGATTVSAGATLELSGGVNLSNGMSIAGTGVGGAGALHSVAGNNTLTGTITATAASTIAADTGTSLTVTNGVTGTNVDTTLSGAGNVTIGAITTGTGNVTVNSTGTVTMNGSANTNTGTTTVNSGTLVLAKAASTNAVNGNLVINGGAVQLNAGNQIADTSSVTLTGSGLLNLNGQTDTIAQLTSSSAASSITLGAGNLTINAGSGQNSSFVGTITGTSASSLNISGSSIVYLSGNNSGLLGTVNVNGGTLNASGSNKALGTGAVSVASGGNLQVQSGITLGNAFTINGTGTSNNGAIENVSANNTLTGTLTAGSAAQVNSDSGLLTLSGGVSVGAYTLTLGGAGNTTISGAIGGTGGSLVKSDSGTVVLTGANSYTGTTTINSGTLQIGAGGTSGTLGTGNVTDNAALIFNRSDALAVANTISGNGTMTQTGSGATTLSGNNSGFTGTVNVNSGTLVAANAGALGSSTANVNVASGAALGLAGNIAATVGNITISGTGVSNSGALYNQSGNNTVSGNVTVGSNATVAISAGNLTLSGPIGLASGATADTTLTLNAAAGTSLTASGTVTDSASSYNLNVAATGNGTAVLSGSNSYLGNTTVGTAGGISTGTLQINSSNAIPALNAAALTTVYSGTLAIGSGSTATIIGNLTLGGGGGGSTAKVTGPGTLQLDQNLTFDNSNSPNGATISSNVSLSNGVHWFYVNDSSAAANDLTISGAISGNATVDKLNTGTMLLTGANTYSANTKVEAGILSVQNNQALGASGTSTTVNTGATLQLSNAANGNLTISNESLVLAGSGSTGSNGVLENVSGNNTWSGAVSLTSASRIQSDANTLNLNGAISSTNNSSLTVGGVGNTTISGAINTGSGSVTMAGSGTLVLSGNSTFSGGTTVNSGGIISLQGNNALGSGSAVVNSGGALFLDNSSIGGGTNSLTTLANPTTISGTGISNSGALHNQAGNNTFSGNVTLGSSSLITSSTGTSLTMSGSIATAGNALQIGSSGNSGNVTLTGGITGGGSLTKDGSGTFTFAGATMGTVGTVGAMSLANGSMTVGDGTHSTTLNGTSLTTASGTSLLIASGGTVNVTGATTFNGGIGSSSAGTLDVTGNTSLTFNTSISASNLTLTIGGSSIGTNTGALTLSLKNSGAGVTVGTIHITGDTILDFGNSAGTVLSSANLIIDTGVKITVTGWVTVANNAANSTIWKLINTSPAPTLVSDNTTNNTTTSTTLGSTNYTGTPLTQITFNNPTGSIGNTTTWVADTSQGWFDHEIRPTPEPTTYGAILIGASLALVGYRRHKRRDQRG